jgi:hypothetical protein
MKKILLFILLIFIAKCSSPVIESDVKEMNEIAIFFVANNGLHDQVFGYITKTKDPREWDFHKHEVIYDANVFINNTIMDTLKHGSNNNRFNFVLNDFPLKTGDTLKLKIDFPNYNFSITGKTVVPNEVNNIKISGDKNYYYFSWDFNKGNSYEITLFFEKFGNWQPITNRYVGISHVAAIGKDLFFDNFDKIRLEIITYEKNFTNYKLYHKDPSGINAHYGVFFSQTVNLFEINLKNFTYHKIY